MQGDLTGIGAKNGRRENDAYYTPEPCAQRIVAQLVADAHLKRGELALEPSAGQGGFVAALRTVSDHVMAIDVDPERRSDLVRAGATWVDITDFLSWTSPRRFDAIVGNPPFSAAEAHARHALTFLRPGGTLAFLLRSAFYATARRHEFWSRWPATHIYQLVERPSFVGGSTDTYEYSVFVWRGGASRVSPTTTSRLRWKPPTPKSV